MPKTLYVGNLPWSVNEAELKGKFSEITDVLEVRLITDKFSGRSKGFGFVEVPDEDAEKVIREMSGYNWAGRDITINEARPKKP